MHRLWHEECTSHVLCLVCTTLSPTIGPVCLPAFRLRLLQNFAEHTSAVRSIQALHGTKVGDKLLHVSLQTPRLRATAMAGM
jgi:hypothetical protein